MKPKALHRTFVINSNHWQMRTRLALSYLTINGALFGLWLYVLSGVDFAIRPDVEILQAEKDKWELWGIIFLLTSLICAILQYVSKTNVRGKCLLPIISSILLFSCYASYLLCPPIGIESIPLVLSNAILALHCVIITTCQSSLFKSYVKK